MSLCPQLKMYAGNCRFCAFKLTITAHTQLQVNVQKRLFLVLPGARRLAVFKGGEDIRHPSEHIYLATMAHKGKGEFCPTRPMVRLHEAFDGKALAINIRALACGPFDAQRRPSRGEEPSFGAHSRRMNAFPSKETFIYVGGCPCGAVHYQFRSLVKITTVKECNCSCIRGGNTALCTYPAAMAVTFTVLEHLQEYLFGRIFVFTDSARFAESRSTSDSFRILSGWTLR
ncbi:hypothetical protein C8R47DRAFT_1203821 [Mycena vitilis]|nr:hypothetical protein C8R47DRAFT_1203821 [Mycena vitilis]